MCEFLHGSLSLSFPSSFWCYQLFVSSRAILLSIVFKHQQPINKTGRRRMISFVDDFSILLLSWIDRHLPLYLFFLSLSLFVRFTYHACSLLGSLFDERPMFVLSLQLCTNNDHELGCRRIKKTRDIQ